MHCQTEGLPASTQIHRSGNSIFSTQRQRFAALLNSMLEIYKNGWYGKNYCLLNYIPQNEHLWNKNVELSGIKRLKKFYSHYKTGKICNVFIVL